VRALVDLIDHYRPGFADAIVPAEEENIQWLEELGGPLPGALLRFLRTMGGSPPKHLVPELHLGVDEIRLALMLAPWLKDERYLILTRHDGYDADIWMDRGTPTGSDDAMLVIAEPMETPDVPHRTPFAVGLEDFLYVEAFRAHRLSLFDHRARARTAPPADASVVGRALALPEQLGFSRLAAHLTSGLYERGDAAVIVRRAPFDAEIDVYIACEEAAGLGPILDACGAMPGWKIL
jgi:hypothetical protein